MFERKTLHEVNAWAIRENKPLIDMAEDSILILILILIRAEPSAWFVATSSCGPTPPGGSD